VETIVRRLAVSTLSAAFSVAAAPALAAEPEAPPPAGASWPQVCSFRRPLCVHPAPGTPPAFALAALDAAERAWDAVTGALAAPAPDPSLDGAWHVYLVDGVEGGAAAQLDARDVLSPYDRASSFARVDRSTPRGCSLDLALARAVARGSAWRAAPGTDPGSALAEAEALARLATPCAGPGEDALAFQDHPARTLVDPTEPSSARGCALFFGWLDARFGVLPGALVTGLWALSPTRTTDPWRWARVPTGFDVLRVSLRDTLFPGSTLDDALVRFSVERASLVPPARVGWHVPWPARPRRLLAPEPVSPTGAAYVLVDVPDPRGGPPAASLHLEAEWEDYGRMRWVVVKLDAAGRAQGEIPMGSLDKGTHATLTVEQLQATARLLVVGVNVGDTEGPFDPTAGAWEPHGFMLTLGPE
jgi:hypothetical protein